MDIKKIFGMHLKTKRKERKLTQEQLSELSGIDRSYISDIERGLKSISLEKLYLLSRALNLELWELLKIKDESNDD